MLILYLGIVTFQYWHGVISKIFGVLLPFILSFAISYVLYPFTKTLEKWGFSPVFSKFLVLFFTFLFIGWLLALTIPLIYEQLISFTNTIHKVLDQLSLKFHLELGGLEKNLTEALQQLITKLGEYISTGTIVVLGKGIHFLGDFMITLATSIYFFIGMDKIREKVKTYLRKRKSQKWYIYVHQLDQEMTNYLHGLALCMIIQFFEYSLLFYLVGHPNWLLLGVLSSVTTVVPYFGGIVTNIIAILSASAISPIVCLKTVLVVIVFSNVDSYLISPHVYGKTNHINPIFTILTIAFCSSFFGILGIIMALPIYLTVRCTWTSFHLEIKEKLSDSRK